MKKVYNRDEEGIASTVGTIFALMIFTALLGMFMTQVVPVTMKENEAHHDQVVLSQLSNMRSVVDILTMTKDTNYTAYVPIKLGADGIPFFATPTYGQLGLYPSLPGGASHMLTFKFTDKYGNVIWRNSSGSLQFIAPNKYYDAEVFEYADGALLRYNYKAKSAIFSIDPNVKFENLALGYAVGVNSSNGSYVYVRNSNSLNPQQRITLEVWFNLASVPTSYKNILSKNYAYGLRVRDNGVQFRVYDGTTWQRVAGTGITIKPNIWYHLAGVYDGSQLKVYLNGQLLATTAYSGSIATSTNNVVIGSGIVGYVDEARILSYALTDSAVLDDYLSGSHYPNRPNAVLWLHLDEGTGTNAVDSSQYHNNGTLRAGAYWEVRKGVNVVATLQNIYGTPAVITGTETRSIGISMQGISEESYLVGGTLNITVKDLYRFSTGFSFNFTAFWMHYITDLLNNSGLQMGLDYTVSGDTITIFSVENADLRMVYIVMDISR